ncbi:PREDICTED: chaperone protein ClpB1-like [Camelina sativa]|uniref:Chaperone protein ClpB1-like n=1 Tax=Camelina sativa TaxID=90675 RepID=A0ABM1QRL9_CAMSA|nr:PREDICTED: chaperone protein ClpB1-like [Camelina sativa]
MTSNLGAEHLISGLTGEVAMQEARDSAMKEVKNYFRPELLNRLDEIVMFDPMSHEHLRKIVQLQMKNVYGARPIRRWLERKVVTDMSMMIVREEIDDDSIVCVDVNEAKTDLVYRVDKHVEVKTEPTSDVVSHSRNKRGSNNEGNIVTLTKRIKNEVIVLD